MLCPLAVFQKCHSRALRDKAYAPGGFTIVSGNTHLHFLVFKGLKLRDQLANGLALGDPSGILAHMYSKRPNARLTGAHKAYPERCGVSASALNLQLELGGRCLSFVPFY
jgi:hypothetical protein